jgi:hypothetical protein
MNCKHNHRSRVAIPAEFKLYPEHLRAAGYYCTNNSKTDYNVAHAGQPWDESSNRAHFKNRAPGRPVAAAEPARRRPDAGTQSGVGKRQGQESEAANVLGFQPDKVTR